MQWFYADELDQQHEVDEEALKGLAESGVVGPDTLVWNETMDDWQTCRQVRPDFFGGTPLPPTLTNAQRRQITQAAPGDLNYQPPLDTVALCSLIFGVVAFLCVQPLGIVAIICGHIALKWANETPNQSTNKGLAIGGLATGYFSIAIFLFIVIIYAVIFGAAILSGDFDT